MSWYAAGTSVKVDRFDGGSFDAVVLDWTQDRPTNVPLRFVPLVDTKTWRMSYVAPAFVSA